MRACQSLKIEAQDKGMSEEKVENINIFLKKIPRKVGNDKFMAVSKERVICLSKLETLSQEGAIKENPEQPKARSAYKL